MARIELANGWEPEDKHRCIDAYRQGVKGDWFIRFWYRDGGGFDSREAALAAARRFAASYYITDAVIEDVRTEYPSPWVAVTQGGDRDYVTRRLAGAFYDFQRACQPPEPKPAADTKADKLAALVRDVASSLRAAGDKGTESARLVEGRLREIEEGDGRTP